MALITIREVSRQTDSAHALLSIAGLEYPITVTSPFSQADEERLEWYFERYVRLPTLSQVKAQQVEASLTGYGEALFRQIFAAPPAYAAYLARLQTGVDAFRIEIIGSPEFQRLHWEALKDPDLPQPWSVLAPLVRRHTSGPILRAAVNPTPTLNLLLVTARPDGRRDPRYRTISRPLLERLRRANVPAQVDIVRPGSYRALVQHLEDSLDRRGAGYYHVLHFDLHGALLTFDDMAVSPDQNRYLYRGRYGRPDIAPYQGHKAFLFFEGNAVGQSDPVEASELARLLLRHQIPLVVLNACQSGKQIGVVETSLGSHLIQAGAQTVLAMGETVTVSAAELFMGMLYNQLFAGKTLATAIRRARLELFHNKTRHTFFDQTVEVEDWLLPIVYTAGGAAESPLQIRPFTPPEQSAYYERQAIRYQPHEPLHGFVGRDLDILQLEKQLLTVSNILLIRGLGGVGKTSLLHHLGSWWQTTGLVEQVFYFGYDEQAWNLQQIMAHLAKQLWDEADYYAAFLSLSLAAQQSMLAQRLRAERHLLMLDNLESVAGAHLSVQNTLSSAEQAALRQFLTSLTEGQTFVLLGSRGKEAWLPQHILDIYDLPGLDPEAASVLAERILQRHKVTRYRHHPALQKLLDLLDGYPLAIEVALVNLARQNPADLLAALQAGDAALDIPVTYPKTNNILRCIAYSHSNLSPDIQELLTCLAPFTNIVNTKFLPQYSDKLRQQPALAHLPFERWPEVLAEGLEWGLFKPHPTPDFLSLQPTFPYFLRSYLSTASRADTRRAIETAFRQHYHDLSGAMTSLLHAQAAAEMAWGQQLVKLEYDNLVTALSISVADRASFIKPYHTLSRYLDVTAADQRGLELGQTVLAQLQTEDMAALPAQLQPEAASVFDDVARRQLQLKQYQAAETNYRQALALITHLPESMPINRNKLTAPIYHQLGQIAAESRQWAQAEAHYRQALAIRQALGDLTGQADTHHQLGRAAEAQQQWAQAGQQYHRALEIFVKTGHRRRQGAGYHQLGVIAEQRQQWAQSEQYYQQALEIFTEYNDRRGQAKVYQQLGRIAQARQQWAPAENHYRRAFEIFIEINDSNAQADTYTQLGTLAQAQQQWAQAEQYYQRAREIYEATANHARLATLYYNLGLLAEAQQQWDTARQQLQQALAICRATADETGIALLLDSLTRLDDQAGQHATG